jgi:hypothetical protein
MRTAGLCDWSQCRYYYNICPQKFSSISWNSYLLSELHSGSRRLPIFIIAGSLHHSANLPTVERQWRHNHAHLNFICPGHHLHQEGASGELVLISFGSGCIPCSSVMRLCSTLGGPDPFFDAHARGMYSLNTVVLWDRIAWLFPCGV